jgi:hypothetical protein
MKYIVSILLLVISFSANAQQNYPRDITLTLTQPTLYTDGTTIEPGELVNNRYNCARNDGTVVLNETRSVKVDPGAQQSETFVGVIPQPGTYTCYAFAATADEESDASAPAFKKYTGKPTPPVQFTFE